MPGMFDKIRKQRPRGGGSGSGDSTSEFEDLQDQRPEIGGELEVIERVENDELRKLEGKIRDALGNCGCFE